MNAKEAWPPLAAGLVTALLIWFAPMGGKEADAPRSPDEPALGLQDFDWSREQASRLWVFPEGPRVHAGDVRNLTVLAVSHNATACAPPAYHDEVLGDDVGLTCPTPAIASKEVVHYRIVCIRAPCGQPAAPWISRDASPEEPSLGVAGYNATRMTIYVFYPDGNLAATTDTQWASRFTSATSPIALPNAVWYLGSAAEAPQGTSKPPAAAAGLLREAQRLMQGLPAGGIVSGPYHHALLGDLWLTGSLDEVVYAP